MIILIWKFKKNGYVIELVRNAASFVADIDTLDDKVVTLKACSLNPENYVTGIWKFT